MRKLIKSCRWPLCICACVAAVLCAHAWKWPRSSDPIVSLHEKAALLAKSLPVDSPVALRVVGLPEDYFNHLRYLMIPRPLEMKMPRAERVLLLTADSSAQAGSTRLLYERPDLELISKSSGQGFQLACYKRAF